MPQLAKLAQGDHRPAVELRFEVAQLVGRLAETAELLGERFGGQRVFRRLGQRLRRLEAASRAVGRDGRNSQRASDRRLHLQIQRHAALRLTGGVRLAKPASRPRIVGLPDFLAKPNCGEVDRAVTEGQLDRAGGDFGLDGAAILEDFVHAAALFGGLAAIPFEDDAVAAP